MLSSGQLLLVVRINLEGGVCAREVARLLQEGGLAAAAGFGIDDKSATPEH